MKKERQKSKKGCWWRVLMIILMLLLAGATVLLFSYFNNRNKVDTEFQSLVNREFDSTNFSDQVSDFRTQFANNIRLATGSSDVCDDNGTIDFEKLLGEDSRLINAWVLGKYDLANYCSQRNSLTAVSDDNLEMVLGITTINRIDLTISENIVNYTIIYEIKGSSLSSRFSLNNVPTNVYITAKAIIDLTLSNPVTMYNYTVNKLTAEESEYCLKKMFGESNYTQKLQTDLAYMPFSYLKELNSVWKSRWVLVGDSIKIVK